MTTELQDWESVTRALSLLVIDLDAQAKALREIVRGLRNTAAVHDLEAERYRSAPQPTMASIQLRSVHTSARDQLTAAAQMIVEVLGEEVDP